LRHALAMWVALGLLLQPLSAAAQAPVDITLEQALAEALARNPALAVERREIDIAEGARRQAAIYPFNPELELEGGVVAMNPRRPAEVYVISDQGAILETIDGGVTWQRLPGGAIRAEMRR
jgi:outer membrane protein TolC